MASGTRTRYAKCGGVDIAYQILGEGPIDVLLFTGATVPIECMDEEPSLARFQRRLASFGRLLRFDRRGVGLSDRGSASAPPTMEQWADDGVAVMDAVGSEQALVLAPFVTAHAGLMLAIAHRAIGMSGLLVRSGPSVEDFLRSNSAAAAEQSDERQARIRSVTKVATARSREPQPGEVEESPCLVQELGPERVVVEVGEEGMHDGAADRGHELRRRQTPGRSSVVTHEEPVQAI